MKKLFIAALVTLIGLAFTAPSFAIEHEFGGYWRVRMYTQKNFDGSSDEAGTPTTTWALTDPTNTGAFAATPTTTRTGGDVAKADTRTRLYYTATINDNLKFVNKFEMDADWGGTDTYGRIGADAVNVQVKHTYADFNLGALNAKVGTQGTVIQRGFIFDDDFSGVVLSGAGVTAKYIKIEENDDNVAGDVTGYSLSYAVDLDTVKLTPVFTYVDDEDDDYVWFAGLDVDATLGAASLWGTFIYNGGEDANAGATDDDIDAWLVAAGATFKLTDMFSIHGQAFYATGDDNNLDNDDEAFVFIPGQSYYWSEIMGKGLFDMGAGVSNNSPGTDNLTNITAANLGVTFAPMEKLTLTADLWYARLNEVTSTPANPQDEDLGFEIDLRATYELVDGLTLDVVGAYLFADDGTTGTGINKVTNEEDPWEFGTQLSLSF